MGVVETLMAWLVVSSFSQHYLKDMEASLRQFSKKQAKPGQYFSVILALLTGVSDSSIFISQMSSSILFFNYESNICQIISHANICTLQVQSYYIQDQPMDSPMFGISKNQPTQHHRNPINPLNNPIEIIALLTFQQNLNKLRLTYSKIQQRLKRECFLEINQEEKLKRKSNTLYPTKQAIWIFKIEYSLTNMVGIIDRVIVKHELSFIQKLKIQAYGGGQRRYDRLPYKTRNVSEWKQNSNYNILDLSIENRKLKQQIKKQKSEEESFIEKMNTLLNSHQVSKNHHHKKK